MTMTNNREDGCTCRLSGFVVRNRLAIIAGVLIITAAAAFGITRIQTDVIISDLFPQNHPYLQLMKRFGEVFGEGGSRVVIAVNRKNGDIFNENTLEKIKDITSEIELWNEIYRQFTISISSNDAKIVNLLSGGEIRVEPLMYPDIPADSEEMDRLKKNIFSDPSYNGIFVAEDGSAALIFTEFKENISYENVFKLMREVVDRHSDADTSISVIGFPMLMGWIYSFKYQMYVVFAISVGLMMVILYLIFRNLLGIVAPTVMLAICTLLGLGFTGWIQMNFSPLLYVLAFLVGARMLSNSVQITHRYLEEFDKTCDVTTATYNTVAAMWKPNAAAVLTDAMGFLVLAVAKIVLMQQLAIIMSFWMITIALSGIMVPVICSYMPIKHEKICTHDSDGNSWLGRLNMRLLNFVSARDVW